MESFEKENWIRENLTESLNDYSKAKVMLQAKQQLFNSKLYKYCPVWSDDLVESQKYLDNIKDSQLYFSQISNFNDPFDSFVTFSIEVFLNKFLSPVLSNQLGSQARMATDLLSKAMLSDANTYEENQEITESLESWLVEQLVLSAEDGTLQNLNESNFQTLILKMFSSLFFNPQLLNKFSAIGNDPIRQEDFFISVLKKILTDPAIVKKLGMDVTDDYFSKMGLLMGTNTVPDGAIDEDTIKFAESVKAIKPETKKMIEKIYQTLENTFKITCFTTKADNALMWAHYANKHQGFCIEYDFNMVVDADFLINLYPVIYTNERPSVPYNLFDISDLKNPKISTSTESTVELIIALLKKSDIWEYEDEWRLVIPDLKENRLAFDCISKVILGCKISPQTEAELLNICENKNIKLSKMYMDDSHYRLIEKNIT